MPQDRRRVRLPEHVPSVAAARTASVAFAKRSTLALCGSAPRTASSTASAHTDAFPEAPWGAELSNSRAGPRVRPMAQTQAAPLLYHSISMYPNERERSPFPGSGAVSDKPHNRCWYKEDRYQGRYPNEFLCVRYLFRWHGKDHYWADKHWWIRDSLPDLEKQFPQEFPWSKRPRGWDSFKCMHEVDAPPPPPRCRIYDFFAEGF